MSTTIGDNTGLKNLDFVQKSIEKCTTVSAFVKTYYTSEASYVYFFNVSFSHQSLKGNFFGDQKVKPQKVSNRKKKPEKSHELPTKWREQNANFYWYVEAIGLSKALKQGQHDFCCLWLQDGPESSNDVACLLNKLRNRVVGAPFKSLEVVSERNKMHFSSSLEIRPAGDDLLISNVLVFFWIFAFWNKLPHS